MLSFRFEIIITDTIFGINTCLTTRNIYIFLVRSLHIDFDEMEQQFLQLSDTQIVIDNILDITLCLFLVQNGRTKLFDVSCQ